jgi:YesN/AraC family two-component response regulator
MILYIRNMVCIRCIMLVKAELKKLGIKYITVEVGEVITEKEITPLQRKRLNDALQKSGLELINVQNNDFFEKLKSAISDLEQHSDKNLKTSFSDYISLNVHGNFITLNKLFAEIEGITIEKYIIRHKMERVKELLAIDGLSLAEIALKMHYRNAAQLSVQFKSITGLSPSHFRQLRQTQIINPEDN